MLELFIVTYRIHADHAASSSVETNNIVTAFIECVNYSVGLMKEEEPYLPQLVDLVSTICYILLLTL